jgi:alkylhydroperoxidase/carboxymuconolactone decarboxylase family protein YurZ
LHVQGALKAGATKEEIVEAGMQAVLMHGGPALMYMTPLEEALEEFANG